MYLLTAVGRRVLVPSELNFKIIGAAIFEPFMNQYA